MISMEPPKFPRFQASDCREDFQQTFPRRGSKGGRKFLSSPGGSSQLVSTGS